MAGLKEVRERITSIGSTMQITSAMKMVSAAKLKKAQDRITQMRPYSEKLTEILQNLSGELEGTDGKYSAERDVEKVLVVAVASNRGLCGGFNAYVNKKVGVLINETYAGKEVSVLAIGKKVSDYWTKRGNLASQHNELFDDLTFENVAAVTETVMDAFANGDYDHVVLVYNQFKNAATFNTSTEQFLPVVSAATEHGVKTTSVDYIFEPGKGEILEDLIPLSLKTQIFKATLDSNAAEHGARMTAMHKATDNASDMLKELKLTYNKARQASITNEILEIVGGAAALEDA
ncbi:MAG: F-type H+-transporting ATPase subunit gamma [Granulosicoccus sp.]|jgi:F-type H+-transporting ATPase subunit gamma